MCRQSCRTPASSLQTVLIFFGGDARGPLLAQSESHTAECPPLAQSGHSIMSHLMSLSGVKQTSPVAAHMSAYDPKRTWALRSEVPLNDQKQIFRRWGLFDRFALRGA